MLGAGHVGVHHGFHLAAGPQGVVAGEKQLPVAVSDGLQGMAGFVPVVKIPFQVQLIGAGCPLPVDPASLNMVEAEIIVGVGKVVQGLALGKQPGLGAAVEEHPQVDVAGEGGELGV